MRVLAIDVGSKRLGLALSDEFGWTAQPLPSLVLGGARRDPWTALPSLVAEHGVTTIVVGLPLNMDGSDSRQTRAVRRFADRLRTVLPETVAIEWWDERLTSRQSERTLGLLDVSHRDRRKRSDQIAAQFILQGYLERRRDQ